mmetsp:Transcript_39369/g.60183  ORF Transcript_39369/g.60183 Transcript_39369/m.60183 type:complete len:121 (-) Transcript_39369:42-404(-)
MVNARRGGLATAAGGTKAKAGFSGPAGFNQRRNTKPKSNTANSLVLGKKVASSRDEGSVEQQPQLCDYIQQESTRAGSQAQKSKKQAHLKKMIDEFYLNQKNYARKKANPKDVYFFRPLN